MQFFYVSSRRSGLRLEINLAELLCLQQIVQDCKKQGGNYYEII